MSNWCSNEITIHPVDDTKEAKEQFKAFLELIEADIKNNTIGNNLFNRLVPMPEELKITAGSSTNFGIAVAKSLDNNDHTEIDGLMSASWLQGEAEIKTREDLIKHLTTGENPSANLKEGRQALVNKEKYGYHNWYEWSLANWGTKWDVGNEIHISCIEDEKLEFSISTAWSPPLTVFTTAGEKFDKLYIEIEYEESGCGFEGTFNMEYGESSDDSRAYDTTKNCEQCEEENGCEECSWGVDESEYPENCPCLQKADEERI